MTKPLTEVEKLVRLKGKLQARLEELTNGLEPIFTDPQRAHIVFDHQAKEYYHKTSDIYLFEDDIEFMGLPPTQLVPFLTRPLTESIAVYLSTHNK